MKRNIRNIYKKALIIFQLATVDISAGISRKIVQKWLDDVATK